MTQPVQINAVLLENLEARFFHGTALRDTVQVRVGHFRSIGLPGSM